MKYSQKTLLMMLLLVLATAMPLAATEHPVKLDKDADCASCHEDKAKGKAVHSAIAMGCATCHDVKTQGETTTVEFTTPKDQLCFTCHDKAKEEVLHGPYEKGQCMSCHDPHTSDYPKQLRAEGNALCLECHATRAKMEDTVSLFGGKQTMPKADFEQVPKIVPTMATKTGHPFAKHPIADVPDPLRNEKMTCLSCHQSHAAAQEKLITTAKTNNGDICEACHTTFENKVSEEALKKFGPIEEKNRKELQDQQKKIINERPSAPPQKSGSN